MTEYRVKIHSRVHGRLKILFDEISFHGPRIQKDRIQLFRMRN